MSKYFVYLMMFLYIYTTTVVYDFIQFIIYFIGIMVGCAQCFVRVMVWFPLWLLDDVLVLVFVLQTCNDKHSLNLCRLN